MRVQRYPMITRAMKQIVNGVEVNQVGSMTPCTMIVMAK